MLSTKLVEVGIEEVSKASSNQKEKMQRWENFPYFKLCVTQEVTTATTTAKLHGYFAEKCSRLKNGS